MAKDTGLLIERGIHYVVMIFTIGLIVFGIIFAYNTIITPDAGVNTDVAAMAKSDNKDKKGVAKQLPDFIVDKMKPDELGQLKP
ncbi:MAG: hypothetical protein COB36_00150 [Alphaproteobacteria bacterium]|nr:MAG: hypothetical protein COB36_00150 [Alphaproteobacteria bacterium]